MQFYAKENSFRHYHEAKIPQTGGFYMPINYS
jgi:hypothetical protein